VVLPTHIRSDDDRTVEVIRAYRHNVYVKIPLSTLFLTPFRYIRMSDRNIAKSGWCLIMIRKLWDS